MNMEVCHRVVTTAPRTFTNASFHFRTRSAARVGVIRAARPRYVELARPPAFSLRELEIELYTLTQPSGYAIRRDPRRVDTCQRAREAISKTNSFQSINLYGGGEGEGGDANRLRAGSFNLHLTWSGDLYFNGILSPGLKKVIE